MRDVQNTTAAIMGGISEKKGKKEKRLKPELNPTGSQKTPRAELHKEGEGLLSCSALAQTARRRYGMLVAVLFLFFFLSCYYCY